MSSDLSSLFSGQAPLSLSFKVLKNEPPIEPQPDSVPADGKAPQTKRTRAKEPTKARAPSLVDRRTVFVGNIPNTYKKKHIKCLFKEYGTIESVRFRSMIVERGSLPVKVARITQKQLKGPLNAYVVYSSEEEAENSLKLNGTLLGDRHLRVDVAGRAQSHDHRKSVFVGNLPHEVDEEEVRECFKGCGAVEGVRIVRDAKTGIGKGFGFVTFADSSGVLFAVKQNLKLELKGRKLRIFRSKETSQSLFSGVKTSKPVPRFKAKSKDKRRGMTKDGKPAKPRSKKKTKAGAKSQEKGSEGDVRTSHASKRESRRSERPPKTKKYKPRHRDLKKTT